MTQAEAAKVLASIAAVVGNGKPKKAKKAKGTGKKGRTPLTDAERAVFVAANDKECVRVFTEAGYTAIEPRVNVLTYKKWIEKGRKVREGEKSLKVNKFSLFHESQTDALPVSETVQ